MTKHDDVLHFWFEEISPKQRFQSDPDFDKQIRSTFGNTHLAATKSELFSWRQTAAGRLAEIIVLDQFSRNIHRNTPNAFQWDPLALALAQEAVRTKQDMELPPGQRSFLYMPYMHSESPLIHEEAVNLFNQEGLEETYKYELAHKKIIDRFGRYPHRNSLLGRSSTEEEVKFLKTPGSSF